LYTIERFKPAHRSSNPNHIEIHRFVDLKKRLQPLHYTIDRIVGRGRIYTATGATNVGKTTLWTMAGLAVAAGRSDILGLDVERGRVVYLAIENPDDTVSRFAIAQSLYRIPNFMLRDRLFVVTMRRLRALTTILGKPAVVIAAHPIKAATQASLIPYGGGAIVNEVDGNLTLWRVGNTCTLHWQMKLRGPNFAPVLFRFRNYGCDEVRDNKGRRVVMPLLVPYAERDDERLALPAPARLQPQLQHEQHRPREDAAPLHLRDLSQDRRRSRSDDASPDVKLLRAMIADPNGTQEEWATATGVVKSNLNRRLTRLQRSGLVHSSAGKWTVAPTGRRVARPTQMKMPPVAGSR
jgi:hypothetical protein